MMIKMIKKFPDVEVGVAKKSSRDMSSFKTLGIPASGLSAHIARVFAAGIENTGNFIGGTVYEFSKVIKCVSSMENDTLNFDEYALLDTIINDFVKRGLSYCVVLDEAVSDNVKKVLKTESDVRSFLMPDKQYVESNMVRALFVPSEKYTGAVWHFKYDPENLKRVIDAN